MKSFGEIFWGMNSLKVKWEDFGINVYTDSQFGLVVDMSKSENTEVIVPISKFSLAPHHLLRWVGRPMRVLALGVMRV